MARVQLVVLIEAPEGGTLNHLGVETDDAAAVEAAAARLTASGLPTTGIDDTVGCYAEKVETWVADPEGAHWEWYVKTADADETRLGQMTAEIDAQRDATVCCAPTASATNAGASSAAAGSPSRRSA